MLEEARVPVLLSQSSLVEVLPKTAAQVVCLDADREALSQLSSDNPISGVKPENLAYVIYTSGSTGQPKGVLIAHQGLCNLATAQIQLFGVQSDSRILQFASLSFDASIWEIVMSIASGAQLSLAKSDDLLLGSTLVQLLQKNAITHVTLPPTALAFLPIEDGLDLQYIIVAGESCSPELVAQWSKGRRFFNAYGPTEGTVCATIFENTASSLSTLPIGRPIANTQTYILDSNDQPVPVGVPGELHIGGVGLARGYKGRPDLTAEKFIPHPFNDDPNSRLYKTGDLARYLPDGNIEYLGRIDNQVKIRGFRIELGEIEAVLAQHPTVRENAVIVHETSQTDKRLIAYLVPHQEQLIETAEIRVFLTKRLPDYMIPSAFVTLEALPLTPNGKIDRRALEPLSVDSYQLSEKSFVAPRTPEEELLAGIWADVLGLEKIGIHDNFFELGGHSLLATQMMSRLSDTFAVELPLRLLFESPTVAGMAQAIDQIRHTGNVATKIVIDFNAEAVLDSTIQLPSGAVEAIAKPHSIFLTGATGFLGAYLLYELLEQTTVDVYCLVRAENADEGKKRLQSKLESYSIWNETFNSRIIPVVGELSQPLLGLSESLFDHLASQIDVIYHNGAMVNFIYPYFELKAANVLGTQEVLKLATQIKAKPVHLISTVSVFSIDSSNYSEVRVVRESDIDDIQKLDGGYSQSKWVAEKLMMQARDRGLPVCIYRPSRITWHSQTGFAHLDDLLNRFIKGCIQLGKVPDGNFEDNMIPVDYVSRAIIHLSQQTESLGKTFHLTNPHLTSWDELFSWFRSKGYPLEQISYIQWRNELRHQKENALSPFLSMFYQDSFSDDLPTKIIWPQFDRQNTQKGLAGTDIVCPPIDTKLLDTYLSYLKKSGFLEAPPLHRS
jgi:amino acid adenylation domain-containing protein/thioester reductase-like protein